MIEVEWLLTSANKNLELTAKWIDELYDPLQSVQNNWGTYGDENNKIYLSWMKEDSNVKAFPFKWSCSTMKLREKTMCWRTISDT